VAWKYGGRLVGCLYLDSSDGEFELQQSMTGFSVSLMTRAVAPQRATEMGSESIHRWIDKSTLPHIPHIQEYYV